MCRSALSADRQAWPPPMAVARRGSSDEIGKVAQKRGLRLRADNLLHDLSVLEDAHSRDVHDPVALRDDRVVVDVQLDDVDLLAVLASDLLEHRAYHAARPAPLGPVIDDDWLGGLQHLSLEGSVGYCLGCAHLRDFLPSHQNQPASCAVRLLDRIQAWMARLCQLQPANAVTPRGQPASARRLGPPRSRYRLLSQPA